LDGVPGRIGAVITTCLVIDIAHVADHSVDANDQYLMYIFVAFAIGKKT
jgi:hypothetical protein